MEKDLFGNEISSNFLRDKFIEPPFSLIDTRTGIWQDRKKKWKELGLKGEVGRAKGLTFAIPTSSYNKDNMQEEYYDKGSEENTSVFDPALCELFYQWFCPKGGLILDPFAGGSVRGVVASMLDFKYIGIDIRPEQIEANYQQANDILKPRNKDIPLWIGGDSNNVLETLKEQVDFIFSCPPYADLEVYSDLSGDLSNMEYTDFVVAYRSIIRKALNLLKSGGYACFVVGEVRDKKGNYYGFVPETIRAFRDCGANFYNELILMLTVGSASMRATRQFEASKKVCKIHQNILVFKKP